MFITHTYTYTHTLEWYLASKRKESLLFVTGDKPGAPYSKLNKLDAERQILHDVIYLYLFIFWWYWGFELRATHLLRRHCTIWHAPRPFCFGYFTDGLLYFLPRVWTSYVHLPHSWDHRCIPPTQPFCWEEI
jgi:hypothetical protein